MAFYTPLLDHNGYDVVMMKATSAPETDGNWSNQDDSVTLRTSEGTAKSLWSFEHNSDIYVVTQQDNPSTILESALVELHIFDPGTDTWATKNEFVAEIGDHADFDLIPSFHGVSLAVRSDGDVVVAFAGDATGSNSRIFYRVRTGSTWGTVGRVDSDTDGSTGPIVIGPDSSDRITFVFGDEVSNAIHTRSLSSTDVLGTEVEIDGTLDSTAKLLVGPGVIDSGNEVYVPYIDASNKISVAQFTSAADPTGDVTIHADVGDNTVEGNGATVIPFVVACLAVDGTNIHLLYADDATQDIFHDSDVDGGGTTDVEDQDAVTCNRISCAVLGTNLDYVWLDGTTVKYDRISLAAAPAFLPNALMLTGVGR